MPLASKYYEALPAAENINYILLSVRIKVFLK